MSNLEPSTKPKKTSGCLKAILIIGVFAFLGFIFDKCDEEFKPTTTVAVASADNDSATVPSGPKIDSVKIAQLKPLFSEKKDEFEGTVFVQPRKKPQYRNQNGMYAYFSRNGDQVGNFRFVIQYFGEDWLFINTVKFNIDGKTFVYVSPKWDRDHDTKVWEWSDQSVTYIDLALLEAIAEGKSVRYRLIGTQYSSDKTLSDAYKKSIKNTLEYYRALGGDFD